MTVSVLVNIVTVLQTYRLFHILYKASHVNSETFLF